MNKVLAIFLLFFLTIFQVKAESHYKDFIVTDSYIWGLTSNGQIKLFNKTTGKPSDKKITNSSEIALLVKDKFGKAVIADKENQIKKWSDEQNSWVVISKYEGEIYGIVFDSKNMGFAIFDKGIEDLITKKFYFTNKSLNHQINSKDKWGKPYCHFIDKNEVIWLGFGYGEWGGNLFAFQTKTKKFLDLSLGDFEIELNPIKSFFEDSNSVYISAGLQHMMTSGIIVRFDNLKATTIFNSESHWSEPTGKDSIKTMIDGEYIGPTTYNSFNNSIYFYSQNGIFSGNLSKDLSKIENWKLVVKPTLHWKSGQPNAVGSPMNVLKITIIDKDKFIFLSQNDGIGFFDKDKLTMIK